MLLETSKLARVEEEEEDQEEEVVEDAEEVQEGVAAIGAKVHAVLHHENLRPSCKRLTWTVQQRRSFLVLHQRCSVLSSTEEV
mmetsp:Transcript_2922/g.7056  ORF Transcript_2922/g.7056 Transcript_2922/m.7056 type:complete len:83 (+) Transcript_2922:2742-2990(+)